MAKQQNEQWLSVVEAAKRLGVTRETVYQAIESGKLRARLTTVTRKVWRINPESVTLFEVSPARQRIGKRGAQQRYGKSESRHMSR
jgi:excisionase family DNA binding protein